MIARPRRSPTPTPLTRRAMLIALGMIGVVKLSASSGRVLAAEAVPDFRVIAHPENPAHVVDRAFLAKLFFKETSTWDDGEVAHPVDLRADSRTRARFSDAIMKRSAAAVRNYWQQRIFSGRGVPPPEVDTDADVVRYVLGHRGAVGYVSGAADVGHAKVLAVSY